MKSLKNLFKILMVLSVLFAINSCKKHTAAPEPEPGDNGQNVDQGIAKEEMLDYYIVSERKSGNSKLAVIYFTQDAGVVKATVHGKGYLRTIELTVANSVFNLDINSNGTLVYTFTVEKDPDGKLKLKSYQFMDQADPNQGLVYATMAKKTEAPPFENSSFKTGDLLFKFSTANNTSKLDWDIRSRQIGTRFLPPPINQVVPILGVAPEVSLPYYSLINLGWKSNNDDFMGASVPSWKNISTPIMLVERNSVIYPSGKQ